MATAVENPSIASARERAAAILFGNEKPAAPVVAEYSVPVATPASAQPVFTPYQPPETTQPARPTAYRSYLSAVEIEPNAAPAPYTPRPYVNANTVTQTVAAPAPVTQSAPVAETSTTVASEIDVELEEDTQYVVKFKPSTIAAVAVVAAIFVLMAVLFIVNIVNLSAASAQIGTLLREEQTLNQQLNQAIHDTEQAKQAALEQLGNHNTPAIEHTISIDESAVYTASTTTNSNGGFFDWLCQTLGHLFG